MGLNDKVSSERVHIGFFGLRNVGKSSLVNAVTGQQLSLVSDVKGTTTDPVKKAMELLPMGPVVIIDTPGIDDEGMLGEMRVKKTREILGQIHVAVLVSEAGRELNAAELELLDIFKQKKISFVVVYNKADLVPKQKKLGENEIYVSAKENKGIYELKEKIAHLSKFEENDKPIVKDLISEGDAVVLVTPIDSAAPKGRLILPQQQTIRDILEAGAVPVVTRETELKQALSLLAEKPKLVITDSQAFKLVDKGTPKDIPLTSFSILFARYKGDLAGAVKGAATFDKLNDGDYVLISEGCTHHRQCGDIGTVKLPAWIKAYTGKDLNYEFTSGGEFPEELEKYSLIIHCGACMLNDRAMRSRIDLASEKGIPMTNYGIAIAHLNGILRRSVEVFPDVAKYLGE
ncbi:MAG: [FeFe] hydrogenase H-cluster maturation GTPase HydF [Ruminococcaceae bacterium]|nr:[FeFe] hydrogenase H-cluster maturation GTPase HydF [Oscillospiraceae bacterium]